MANQCGHDATYYTVVVVVPLGDYYYKRRVERSLSREYAKKPLYIVIISLLRPINMKEIVIASKL